MSDCSQVSNYFEDASKKPLGHEKPEPRFETIKMQRVTSPTVAQSETQAQTPLSTWRKVPAIVPIATWITLSGTVILMNKVVFIIFH